MTLFAVKPEIPQPDIGHVLDVLAHHRPVELHCGSSPVNKDTIEVTSRRDLEERLEDLFPFRVHMAPIDERNRVGVGIALVDGPPISGDGDSMATALEDFLSNALAYMAEWERSLRFGVGHQRYWGWVYRLLLAGDDDHILATLLNEPLD